MTFEEKIKFLRSQPAFKVSQENELRAIAFVSKKTSKPEPNDYIIGMSGTASLILTREDIEKIVRVYPDLEPKLRPK